MRNHAWLIAILHKDNSELALLGSHVAPARKVPSPLVNLLWLALLVATLLLLLPHCLPNGLTAAPLVHVPQLLAAISQGLLGLLIPSAHFQNFILFTTIWAASLRQVPLAGPELPALQLLAALLALLVGFIVDGCGGHSGGVGRGAGQRYHGHQEDCCECELLRHGCSWTEIYM